MGLKRGILGSGGMKRVERRVFAQGASHGLAVAATNHMTDHENVAQIDTESSLHLNSTPQPASTRPVLGFYVSDGVRNWATRSVWVGGTSGFASGGGKTGKLAMKASIWL